jgi:exopolysaccharide biosynthesis predicted pyruvyltransferase EpsI
MDPFEKFLIENRDKRTLLVTPGGNHGDTLIHMSHVKKLEEHGYDYKCFNLEERYSKNLVLGAKYIANIALWRLGSKNGFKIVDVPGDVELILFEGGGYVNDVWYGPTLLNQVLKRNNQTVAVAPQSYMFKEATFETYKSSRLVHLFCREKASYDHFGTMDLTDNIRVDVSPEVALYLEREDLTQYIVPDNREYQLVAFRGDKESAIGDEVKIEVLERCSNPVVRDVSILGSFNDFVSSVENAEKIFTDRLHVAILGSILGKNVTLFGNMYHKNSGVWEFSLKDSVTFIAV